MDPAVILYFGSGIVYTLISVMILFVSGYLSTYDIEIKRATKTQHVLAYTIFLPGMILIGIAKCIHIAVGAVFNIMKPQQIYTHEWEEMKKEKKNGRRKSK